MSRNIRVDYDFADAAITYRWTDESLREDGLHDFGVYATFTEARDVAVRKLRRERDRWSHALRREREARVSDVVGEGGP